MCNQAAKQYLSDYFDLDMSPHYAVMLTGAWGSGKTHFIEKVCDEHKDRKIHYISLYGLSATSEIDDLIYAQLHPILANKHIKFVGKLATMTLKLGGFIDLNGDGKGDVDASLSPKIDLSSIMNADGNPQTIFVFDDFERCGIEAKVLLGYINYYVEHVGAKVVILSNPEKIEDENFQTLKEKVIGQSIEVQMDVDSALTEFIGLFAENPFRQVLLDNEILIKETFNSANYKNLRSLRTSFIALQRLYNALPQKAKDSDKYCEELLTLALPLSLEMSSGQDIEMLLDYWSSVMVADEKEELSKIRNKYPKVRWAQISELERLILQNFLKKGFIDQPLLEQVALASHVFLKDNTPDWMRLCNVYYIDQAAFDTAKKNVIDQLSNHEFTDMAQVLLIYGTLMNFSEEGLFSEKTSDELVGEAKQYVEFVEKNNLDEYAKFIGKTNHYFGFFDGFGGFGVPNSEGRKQLFSWLENKQKAFIENSREMMATALLQEIKNIPKQGDDLTVKFDLNGEYRNFAIFSLVKPSDVIGALSNYQTATEWAIFSYIVKSRFKYSNVDSYDPYLVELDFYKNLNCLLDIYISNHQGKVTILGANDLKMNLSDVIEKLKNRVAQKETMKVNVSAE